MPPAAISNLLAIVCLTLAAAAHAAALAATFASQHRHHVSLAATHAATTFAKHLHHCIHVEAAHASLLILLAATSHATHCRLQRLHIRLLAPAPAPTSSAMATARRKAELYSMPSL